MIRIHNKRLYHVSGNVSLDWRKGDRKHVVFACVYTEYYWCSANYLFIPSWKIFKLCCEDVALLLKYLQVTSEVGSMILFDQSNLIMLFDLNLNKKNRGCPILA